MSLVATAHGFTMSYIYFAIPIFGLLLIGYSIGFFLLSRNIRLNKHKHTLTSSHRALKARRPIIIYLYILTILLIILIERPITVYCWVSSECTIFSQYISPILFGFIVYAYFYIFLIRTWILYYEENFNLVKKDIIWQKNVYLNYLSPSNKFNKSKQDWFLENRLKYGNPQWIFKKILYIPYTISVIICIAIGVSIEYHNHFWYFCINALLMAFPVISILIIWRKMNPVHDFYRIRAELRITIFSWIFFFCLLVINVIIFHVILSDKSDEYELIAHGLSLWSVGICLTFNGLVSTAWIYYLTKKNYFEYSQEFISFEMSKLQKTFENKSMFKRISSKVIPSGNTEEIHQESQSNEVMGKYSKYSTVNSAPSSPTDDSTNIGSSNDVIMKSLDLDAVDEHNEIHNELYDDSKEKSMTGFSSKVLAEKVYSSFPLRDILVTDIGFRLFMQHMTSEYNAECLLFIVSIVRYKYAMNGFKNIEMYSTAATTSAITVDIQSLPWYMPLSLSLIDDVVNPPNIAEIRSISININEDLVTPPHANINRESIENNNNDENKENNNKDPKYLKLHKIKNKKERGRTHSNTTHNPLFHTNTNLDVEAKQDGTLNEIKSWDDAQIAWGTLSHALMIYEKYIRLGALFEINISHRLRLQMKKKFDDLKKIFYENHQEMISAKLQDIMNGYNKFNDNIRIFSKYPEKRKEFEVIFDETAKQIESLMNDSYVRFRQTQTYHRLLKKLVKDQRKKGKNRENFLSKTSSQLTMIKDKLSTKKKLN